jgi:hypothetical protein
MSAIEFAVADVVVVAAEIPHDAPAAPVDRQHLVAQAVGDEDPRLPPPGALRDEPRREGDDVGEQLAPSEKPSAARRAGSRE